jgi:putative oxygen-independent coproporphyrinogen III oxidase
VRFPSLGRLSDFGVYVHIPFCAHRCGYCDFATWADRSHLVDAYVDACITDLDRRRSTMPPATSVFFGGGTPSLLPPERLAEILDAVVRTDDAEVTVECNPDTVNDASFATYVASGVNRVSLGAQSFAPHVLAALDRTHDVANVAAAVMAANGAGIERINLDLIYGTPGETLDDWRASLHAVLDLGVTHVSAYALTIESGTPLGRAIRAGESLAPDDDDLADKYGIADDVLVASGLRNYEISNWAVPGHECRHNVLYWTMGDYTAIGCAAHGHLEGRRWWNVRTPERYIDAIATGTSPTAGYDELDEDQRHEEAFALALRTSLGVECAPAAASTVADLAVAGLLETHGSRVGLTRQGRLLASDVTARLLLAGAVGDPNAVGTRYH